MKILSWFNLTGRPAAGTFFLILCIISCPAAATDRTGDAFLTGYVTSIIERDLHWHKDSYVLKIKNGIARITLFTEDPVRRRTVDRQLREIDGLQEITVVIQPEHAEKPGFVSSDQGSSGDAGAFRAGDLFRSLIADPKQPQFFDSSNSFSLLGERSFRATVGFGETFGLYRSFGNNDGDGLQLQAEWNTFDQLNPNTSSSNLINADATVDLPLTYHYGDNFIRSRIYHQSSHLGDELLQSITPSERINHSYESIDLIYPRKWAWWVSGGGEYRIHKGPNDLKPASAHREFEYRGSNPLVLNGKLVAGQALKSLEEHDWANDTRVKAGLDFGYPNPGQRVEYYGIGGISLGF